MASSYKSACSCSVACQVRIRIASLTVAASAGGEECVSKPVKFDEPEFAFSSSRNLNHFGRTRRRTHPAKGWTLFGLVRFRRQTLLATTPLDCSTTVKFFISHFILRRPEQPLLLPLEDSFSCRPVGEAGVES